MKGVCFILQLIFITWLFSVPTEEKVTKCYSCYKDCRKAQEKTCKFEREDLSSEDDADFGMFYYDVPMFRSNDTYYDTGDDEEVNYRCYSRKFHDGMFYVHMKGCLAGDQPLFEEKCNQSKKLSGHFCKICDSDLCNSGKVPVFVGFYSVLYSVVANLM